MLVSHDASPEMVSGSEKALLAWGQALLATGREISWISPRPGMSVARAEQMGMRAKVLRYPLLWDLIHRPEQIAAALSQLGSEAADSELGREVAWQRPDLIVANSAINAAPACIARERGIPIWWCIHEVLPSLGPMQDYRQWLQHQADLLLVPSGAVAAALSAAGMGGDKIRQLPYAVEIPPEESLHAVRMQVRAEKGWSEDHVVLGWFGSIYAGKGLMELIKAAAQLPQTGREVVLFAAGNVIHPGYFESCKEAAGQLATASYEYAGPLPSISAVLPAIDIVVIPSLVEEAFPNVALEAFACGKAVIAYESGGLREIVQHGVNGCLAGKGDARALQEHIQRLVVDPVLRTQLGMRGRNRAIRLYRRDLFQQRIDRLLQEMAPG